MKFEFIDALKYGKVIKDQSFTTERGCYQILLVRYKNCAYFFKYLNGKLCECCNLNKAKTKKEKTHETEQTAEALC